MSPMTLTIDFANPTHALVAALIYLAITLWSAWGNSIEAPEPVTFIQVVLWMAAVCIILHATIALVCRSL